MTGKDLAIYPVTVITSGTLKLFLSAGDNMYEIQPRIMP